MAHDGEKKRDQERPHWLEGVIDRGFKSVGNLIKRVGADTALFVTVALSGFPTLAWVGTNSWAIVGFAALLLVAWNGTKCVNQLLDERKERVSLDLYREERWKKLRTKYGEAREQLEFFEEDGDQ